MKAILLFAAACITYLTGCVVDNGHPHLAPGYGVEVGATYETKTGDKIGGNVGIHRDGKTIVPVRIAQ